MRELTGQDHLLPDHQLGVSEIRCKRPDTPGAILAGEVYDDRILETRVIRAVISSGVIAASTVVLLAIAAIAGGGIRTGKVILPIAMTQSQAVERPRPDEALQCGDFLRRDGMRPEHLEFVECHEGKDAQLRALVSRYRVQGTDAAAVESQLMRDTGMEALRYVCCGWESTPARGEAIADTDLPIGAYSKVTMTSSETAVHSRTAWPDIPWFYVDVTIDLESP